MQTKYIKDRCSHMETFCICKDSNHAVNAAATGASHISIGNNFVQTFT